MADASLEDPSRTYATSNAPYIKYLAAIKDRWHEARLFEDELQSLVSAIKPFDNTTLANHVTGLLCLTS